jgi:hypothetical protein
MIGYRFGRWASIALAVLMILGSSGIPASKKPFRVLAFYTGYADAAHILFLHDANRWFAEQGRTHGFTYDSTRNWDRLNAATLDSFDVVLFLDTRPDKPAQRAAFQEWMETGGAWMGFHFSAFALTPSDFNQDWDWYHNTFIGAGQYVSNTWRPTSAILRTEDRHHPSTKGLSATFRSAPNEWYRWEKDLRLNPDIDILLSIDSSSFPLGTGPKLYEIWHEGYYPVAWTNRKYRMVYMNMGHDDMETVDGVDRALSSTFSSKEQDRFILNALHWLGQKKNHP